jgi:hypothetical protein
MVSKTKDSQREEQNPSRWCLLSRPPNSYNQEWAVSSEAQTQKLEVRSEVFGWYGVISVCSYKVL